MNPIQLCFLLAAAALPLAAAEPHPSLPGPVVPEGIGVNIHFTTPRPGEMEMLAAAGFRWVRMDFTWSGTERELGKYDFAAYDRLLAALEPHHIRALLILDYSNKLYEAERSVVSEEGRQAYAKWAAAAVAHFQGRGVVWEIWNEPNIAGFWKPQPDVHQYTAMALAACKAIRAAAPKEAIIGPGSSTIDLKFLEACFQAGLLAWWDAVSVHPYRQNGPENAEPEYARLRRLIAQFAPPGKTIPVLSGEWGYSAGWKNFDAAKQGRMLPRELLINLANGVPLSIWYDWHDDGKDPAEPEHHFGTVANDYRDGASPVYEPKPAYLAAKTLTSTLEGCRFAKRVATGRAEDYALLFAKGDDLRLAVWTTAPEPRELALPSGKCRFTVLSHTGEPKPAIECPDGAPLRLVANDTVQYLIAQAANPVLAAAPAAHPLRATVIPPAGEALTARLENLVDLPFRGIAKLVEVTGLEPVQRELAVELAAGQPELLLRFPLSAKPAGPFGAGLRLERGGDLILEVPCNRFAPVPEVLVTGAKVGAEGKPEVGGEQTLTLAAAPDALPDSKAPVLQLSYRMDPGWRYLAVKGPAGEARKIPGEPKAFGWWIYGQNQGVMPRLRVVDAAGQTWQPSGGTVNWTGWRFVRFELNPSCGHWGGPEDGVIHFPVKWDAIFLLDKTRDHKAEGTLHFAAPVVME